MRYSTRRLGRPLFRFAKRYKATTLLLILFSFSIVYRGFFYHYPDGKSLRNPADYAFDVLGFSYHFVMLAFDYGFRTGLTDEYHARLILRYKPQDTYMKEFVSRITSGH